MAAISTFDHQHQWSDRLYTIKKEACWTTVFVGLGNHSQNKNNKNSRVSDKNN